MLVYTVIVKDFSIYLGDWMNYFEILLEVEGFL